MGEAHQPERPLSTVIATPIWKPRPTDAEVAFLKSTDEHSGEIPRWFLSPHGIDLSFYRQNFPEWQVKQFPDAFFASVRTYSDWLTQPTFYRLFTEFEFVVICQLDAVLVKSVTNINMKDTDYIGAPWLPPIKVLSPGNRIYVASGDERREGSWFVKRLGRSLNVGNGGLSIRRVEAHLRAAEWLTVQIPERYRRNTLEDILFCALGPRSGLRIAPLEDAQNVFMETGASGLNEPPDVYGFHGLWRWNPTIARSITGG